MPQLESAGSVALAVVAVALLLVSAAGLGGLVLPPARTTRSRRLDAMLVRLAVGLNLLGLLGVSLGQTMVLADRRSIWLLAGCSLLWLFRRESQLRAAGNYCHGLITPTPQPARAQSVGNRRNGRFGGGRTASGWRAGLAASVTVAVTLGPALCYPSGWDELVYHCVLPRRWLAHGWPAFYQDLPYSAFPSLGEILFWLAAPIESVVTPRLTVWACWSLGLFCLYRLLRRRLTRTMATLFTLAFTLNDTVLLISANCYVESILLLDVAALFLALRVPGWGMAPRDPWSEAAVLGILAGGAAAVKLTGCAVLAAPLIWYVGHACSDRTRFRQLSWCTVFSVGVALSVCLPFYLRPWLATGNPFYPYLCDWFSESAPQLAMSRFHHQIGGFLFGVRGLAAFVDGPLLLAFRSENYDGEFGWQSLVFVALAVIAALAARRPRLRGVVLWHLVITLWFYVFWFLTAQQARFAVSYFLSLVLLSGLGMRLLNPSWHRLAMLTLAMSVVVSVPWHRSDYYRASWLTILGRMSRADYVHFATESAHLPVIQAVHALTGADAKLMLLYEHRGFYLFRRYVIGTPDFQEGPFSPPEQFADSDSLVRVFRKEEITHVVLAKFNPGPDQPPQWIERQQPFLRALEQCAQRGQLRTLWESEGYVLLEFAG